MQDFLHNEETDFHGNFCHDEWDKSYDKVIDWLRSHDKRVAAEAQKELEGAYEQREEARINKAVEETEKRVLAKVRETLWGGLGKKAVRINYHKCEGWNDDDTMEMDTALINRDDVLDLLTSLQRKCNSPSPEHPCLCNCHLEEKECTDCLCGRHKCKCSKGE